MCQWHDTDQPCKVMRDLGQVYIFCFTNIPGHWGKYIADSLNVNLSLLFSHGDFNSPGHIYTLITSKCLGMLLDMRLNI